MNRAIYAKYLSDLAANEKVEFPSRKEMIEFFSMMMGEIYKMYLNASAVIPSAEKTIRLSGEPELITFLAKEKLENLVPSSNSTVLFLKKKMGLKLRKLRLSTKASENAFYDYLLKSLGQGDSINDVFPTNMEFELEGDTVLYGRYC